ncbi:efflux RND transporter periplasmic adaptor subunit [Burkholderiaceae bacterium DAT-1]|nr:efflux RND transporter periplasmic adaptor subunit [Burkholderiaceae bacterium DAT-1]
MTTLKTVSLMTAAALMLLACSKEESTAQPPRPVRTIVATAAASNVSASFSGEVHARHEAQLGFRIPGKLIERLVDTGDRVRKGQILARIDPQDSQLQASAAKSQFEQARDDYQRALELKAKGFISQAQLDARKSALSTAEAQYKLSQNQEQYTSLRAEQDGVIAARLAETGQVVAAGQPVFSFASDGEREIAINVPESRVNELRKAKEIDITLWADAQRHYVGKVREIAPDTDALTRTYAARITVTRPDEAMRLGMTANVNLVGQSAEGRIPVPLTAIYDQTGQPQVWIVEPGKSEVQLRKVSITQPEGDRVWITAGIKAGERIVTAGTHQLHAGQIVKLLEGGTR